MRVLKEEKTHTHTYKKKNNPLFCLTVIAQRACIISAVLLLCSSRETMLIKSKETPLSFLAVEEEHHRWRWWVKWILLFTKWFKIHQDGTVEWAGEYAIHPSNVLMLSQNLVYYQFKLSALFLSFFFSPSVFSPSIVLHFTSSIVVVVISKCPCRANNCYCCWKRW